MPSNDLSVMYVIECCHHLESQVCTREANFVYSPPIVMVIAEDYCDCQKLWHVSIVVVFTVIMIT